MLLLLPLTPVQFTYDFVFFIHFTCQSSCSREKSSSSSTVSTAIFSPGGIFCNMDIILLGSALGGLGARRAGGSF